MYILTHSGSIKRLLDNAVIPTDPGNIDYQEYCAWVEKGNTPAPPAAPTAEELCAQIDAEADAARLKIAGDSLRMVEYQRAEAEAKAYAAAGYTGTVPRSIEDWAEAKGWTAQAATDDILRASAAWNDALYAFRGIRLKGKEAVKAAAESDRQAAADTAIAQIAAVLAQVA